MSQVNSKELIQRALPELQLTQFGTKSPAWHSIKFQGRLVQWPNFRQHVSQRYRSENWAGTALSYKTRVKYTTDANLESENFRVGDEHGVQGRMAHGIGHHLNAIFTTQKVDLMLADFKCSAMATAYSKVPDMALITRTGSLKAVGELKTPWIESHDLGKLELETDFLPTEFGQVASYMYDIKTNYAFLSTYNYTIFLRSIYTNGQWELQYSPSIHFTSSWGNSTPTLSVSVRQCFYHWALLAGAVPLHALTMSDHMSREDWADTVTA
ncbi:hypothetical protein N7474_004775 [Penicillium riverlandense]|uniref:uncharacterized protein n=1 Tax=Penicillium riverlandense TaxID=1903569 RepID=UPI0025477DE0|nr:uncharacterized protein N7474_004775 [Penicillium riverlandense]KAJ5819184.1 hypothetical protein N7474_004775 [Penicillium riverlandense]